MNLESFSGFDSSEGMNEQAFEAFREKMARAAAQIAAIKKEEKKQKKKEDDLIVILLKFIKKSTNNQLVLLISRVLEINIPANFILAIVQLSNEEIRAEIGDSLSLPPGDQNALVFFKEESTFSLEARITLDNWVKSIMAQAQESPQKLLKSGYKEEKTAKQLLEIYSFVVTEYLKQNKIEHDPIQITKLSEFILKGILSKTKEEIDNRAQLDDLS